MPGSRESLVAISDQLSVPDRQELKILRLGKTYGRWPALAMENFYRPIAPAS